MNKKLKILSLLVPITASLNVISCQGHVDRRPRYRRFSINCFWGEGDNTKDSASSWNENNKSKLEFNYSDISNIEFPLESKFLEIKKISIHENKIYANPEDVYYKITFKNNKQTDPKGSFKINYIKFSVNMNWYNMQPEEFKPNLLYDVLSIYGYQYNDFFNPIDDKSYNELRNIEIKEGWTTDEEEDPLINTEINWDPIN